MAPFNPLDRTIQWETTRGIEATRGLSCVFGTGSSYEAFLFVLAHKQIGATNLLGAGCNEEEVEGLVDSADGPLLLFLVDSIAKDCGVGLVKRLRARRSDLKAMLLVDSQEAYLRNPEAREAFDGIASGGNVGRGGLLACVEAINRGERYLDSLLEQVEGDGERSLWNDLNQREREIVPLLAKGLKNREIAAELFIAETTTRDYVSSILSKLQVSNRAAAAAWAIEQGFVGG